MVVMTEDKIVMKKIGEIKPYIRNPRKNEKTVELLCKLIPEVGFNVPLVIDQNGIIVKGHARYAAAIRLGMTEVPCIITHADADAVKVDRITDNKIAEYSQWMNEELEQEISEISFDFSDLGLSHEEIGELLENPSEAKIEASESVSGGDLPSVSPEKPQKAPERYYKCVCDGCGHVQFIKASEIGRS